MIFAERSLTPPDPPMHHDACPQHEDYRRDGECLPEDDPDALCIITESGDCYCDDLVAAERDNAILDKYGL